MVYIRFHKTVDSELEVDIRAGIFKKSMGARNQVGIGLSYRTARPDRLVEFIPWNRFLGSTNVKNTGLVQISFKIAVL